MIGEQQLFESPETVKAEPKAARESSFSGLVVRRPGWHLIASRLGIEGWHRVRTVGLHGSVVTACGITGRVVQETQRMITECLACADKTTS